MAIIKTIWYREEKLDTLVEIYISSLVPGAGFTYPRKRGKIQMLLNEHGEEQLLTTN